MPTLEVELNPNLFYNHEKPAAYTPFFSAPKIGSTPILLQESTYSFFTQELFGVNVISLKNKNQNDKDDLSESVRIYNSCVAFKETSKL